MSGVPSLGSVLSAISSLFNQGGQAAQAAVGQALSVTRPIINPAASVTQAVLSAPVRPILSPPALPNLNVDIRTIAQNLPLRVTADLQQNLRGFAALNPSLRAGPSITRVPSAVVNQVVETAKMQTLQPQPIENPLTGSKVIAPAAVASVVHAGEFMGFLNRGQGTPIDDPLVNPWGKQLVQVGQDTGLQVDAATLNVIHAPKVGVETAVGETIEWLGGSETRATAGELYRATDLNTPLGMTQEISQAISPGTVLKVANVGKRVSEMSFTKVAQKIFGTAKKAVPAPKPRQAAAPVRQAVKRAATREVAQAPTARPIRRFVGAEGPSTPAPVRRQAVTPRPQTTKIGQDVQISDINHQLVETARIERKLEAPSVQRIPLGTKEGRVVSDIFDDAERGVVKQDDLRARPRDSTVSAGPADLASAPSPKTLRETVSTALTEPQPKASWWEKAMTTMNVGVLGAVLGAGALVGMGLLGEEPLTPKDFGNGGYIDPSLLDDETIGGDGCGYYDLPGGTGLFDPSPSVYSQLPQSVQDAMGPGGYIGLDSNGDPSGIYDESGRYVRELTPEEEAIVDAIVDENRPLLQQAQLWAAENPVMAAVIVMGVVGSGVIVAKKYGVAAKRKQYSTVRKTTGARRRATWM